MRRGAVAGTWLVLAVLGCMTELNWHGQGRVAAAVLGAQGYASKGTTSLQLPPAALAAEGEHGKVKPRQHRSSSSSWRKGLVRSGDTGPDRSIQRRVQRALSKMEDFDVSILEHYGSSLRGMSVSELAGAEAVGDVKALTTLMQPPDVVGDTSRPRVGHIVAGDDQVPVYAFSGEGDDDNITIPGIGDVAIGNLSTSRQYVRLLTCAQVASVHHQALKDDDVDLQICTFVQKHCRPRGGLLNYLELPYCHFDRQPWIGGLFLLLWTFVLLVWLTAQVPFLIPSLNTMSKICNMSQAVAGVTFLAFGNGCADLFSMLAATLSGPGGMELAVGEVLGNGMFVFCGVQGVIALVTPFCVNSLEYIRDCIFYAVSVIAVAVVLLDGQIVVWEGVVLCALYVIYVLVVLHYDPVLKSLGFETAAPEVVSGEDGDASPVKHYDVSGAHGTKDETQRLKQYMRLLDAGDSPLSLLFQFLMPFDWEWFLALPWYRQAYEILKIPTVILLKVTIPVVDQELPNEGWIRPVATLQMFCFPLLFTGFTLLQDLPASWLTALVLVIAWGVTICVSALLATMVWISSVGNEKPEFWQWMGFIGFVGALMIIYTTAKEIVNVILAFGVVFEVGTLLLGVTILAVGIGMQDLVTCVGVARAGYATMAASACVGCALMNIFVGLGLSGIMGPLLVEDPYRLYISVQLLCCLGFMLFSIIVALITMSAYGWQAGRVFGVGQVVLYVLFIVASVLIDVFGADAGNSLVARSWDES